MVKHPWCDRNTSDCYFPVAHRLNINFGLPIGEILGNEAQGGIPATLVQVYSDRYRGRNIVCIMRGWSHHCCGSFIYIQEKSRDHSEIKLRLLSPESQEPNPCIPNPVQGHQLFSPKLGGCVQDYSVNTEQQQCFCSLFYLNLLFINIKAI